MVGVAASRLLRRKHTKEDLAKGKAHGIMILSFILGAIAAGTLGYLLSVRAIWFTLLPLAILFADLLRGDLAAKA
jgi:uncharacterized membrane protein YoaK (UPF0700 family)